MRKTHERRTLMAEQKVITRNRPIKSCQYCYNHKLKCDKAQPCSACISCKTTDQCIYGFAKKSSKFSSGTITAKDKPINKKPFRMTTQRIKKVGKGSAVYKSKFSYPFFSSSINDKILSAGQFDKSEFADVSARNELHKFDRSASPARSLEEGLALLPSSKEAALSHVETYFERINPILPLFSQERVINAFTDVYHSLHVREAVDVINLLVIMAIFFCSSYAEVASGVIPDLLLCNNYYRTIRLLLDILEFPFRPHLEPLQAFTAVHFVIDPNMVDASAYAPMLVRMGQELGLHKGLTTDTIESKLMWNMLLYIEGSSSVVRGFPFLASASVMNEVPLPELEADIDCGYPISFTTGRCKINHVFRDIMELTSRKNITLEELESAEAKIETLYKEICTINVSLLKNHPAYSAYYSSTLNVFLYRLHLRYYALSCLKSEEDKLLYKTSHVVSSEGPIDIMGILAVKQKLRKEVIQLSLLLLLHTYKRLVQKDIDKFAWYTRGSTVMQYLFVIIKDVFENPEQPLEISEFSAIFRQTIDDDMLEIIQGSPVLCKYVLVEGVLALMELKLVALWSNEDIYKLLLVKAVKDRVWQVNGKVLKDNEDTINSLKKCKLFAIVVEQLQNLKSINFEECLEGWESDDFSVNMDKILTSWAVNLPNL